MKGLRFFSKTSSQDCWTIAAYHSPHSLTWSWVFSLVVRKRGEGKQLAFNKWRDNNGLQWALQLYRGVFQWHYQKPMWYAEIWRRERDQKDRQGYEEYLMRSGASRPEAAPEHRTLQ